MFSPQYFPSTLLADANALKVSAITLAADPPNPTEAGGAVYVNHWVIYLQLEQGASIRLDMSPNSSPHQPATLVRFAGYEVVSRHYVVWRIETLMMDCYHLSCI